MSVKFIVIGCGHIGKRHATIISQHADCELVALCDNNIDTQKNLTSFSVPIFSNIADLRSSEIEADVLCVATPNGFHCEHALHGLQQGWDVVIEKPMGLSSQECQEVIDLATKKGKNVFCVMQNRYTPIAQWLKSVIEAKLLGKIFMVNIQCYWNRDARYYTQDTWHGSLQWDGGVIFTQFSHFLDMMYWLFGGIKGVSAEFFDFNHAHLTEFEDSGIVTFDFEKEGKGIFQYSTSVWNQNLESSILILGEKGSIKVGGQYMNDLLYCDIENYTVPTLPASSPPNDYGAYKGSAANHHYVIQNVVDVILHNKTIDVPANEGIAVVHIIEQMYQKRPKK